MSQPDGVWVLSEVAPDGTYVVGLHCGEDRAWILNRDEAIGHAVAVVTQAERAEYDAAIIALLHGKLGMPLSEAAEFVARDIRPDRPAVDEPGPLVLVPGVSQRTQRGFLTLRLGGNQVGQWELGDAHRHALGVLQAAAAVDNDAALYRLLAGVIGLEEPKARAVVADLAQHRAGPQP